MEAQCRTFIFEGVITAVSPLATCSKDLKDREGKDNQPIPVPSTTTALGKRLMYPSTGIRGALRRRGRDIIRAEAIKATGNNTPFDLDEHYYNTVGGIKGEGAQDRSTVAMEAEWRRRNPLLSLFGAGDAGVLGFVQGRCMIGNAVAQHDIEPVIFSGARTDDFYRDKSQIRFLSEDDIKNLISRAKGGKDRSALQAEIKSVTRERAKAAREGNTERVAEIDAKLNALEAELKAVKDASGTTDVSVGMPLAGWQAIPQDTVMDHRMILARSNEIELGLLVEIIRGFAADPILGAHFANGCGLVSGRWTAYEANLDGRKEIGSISFEPYAGIQITGDILGAAAKAFNDFLGKREWDFGVPKAI